MQPAYYEDLNEIKSKIWSMLEEAVTNRNSQFRIPVLLELGIIITPIDIKYFTYCEI